MTPRPSKRAVMEALADVLVEPNWALSEYITEHGCHHCVVRVDGQLGDGDGVVASLNTRGGSKWMARRRMIELCENFHGGPRL